MNAQELMNAGCSTTKSDTRIRVSVRHWCVQVLAACGYEATGACVHPEPGVAGVGAKQVNGGGGGGGSGVRWEQLVRRGSKEGGALEAGPSASAAATGPADGSGPGASTGGAQALASGSGSGSGLGSAHAPLPRMNPPFSLLPANYALYTQPTLYQAATTQVHSTLFSLTYHLARYS